MIKDSTRNEILSYNKSLEGLYIAEIWHDYHA